MGRSYAENNLPFPRGKTFNEDGLVTMSATLYDHLDGRIYAVPDTEHDTGVTIDLIAIRNRTGGSITVARKFLEFKADAAKCIGRQAGQFPCNTAGAVVLPIDDAYAVGDTIAENDIFWCVYRGWCSVLTDSSNTNYAAHMDVTSTNAGVLKDGTPAAAEYIVGRLDYYSSYDADTAYRVWVAGNGFSLQQGA